MLNPNIAVSRRNARSRIARHYFLLLGCEKSIKHIDQVWQHYKNKPNNCWVFLNVHKQCISNVMGIT